MIDKQIEITGKLAQNEETLGKLYSVYADKFPDYREFWLEIGKDESKHRATIRQLQDEVEKGRLTIKPYRFNVTAIKHQIQHVEDEIKKAALISYSVTNALSAALNFETSLLEFKYFEVFDTFSPEIQNKIAAIAEDTKRHAIKVRDAWQKNMMN